jgi:hypothetical protein
MEGSPSEQVQLELQARLLWGGSLGHADLEHVAARPADGAAHPLEEGEEIGDEGRIFESDEHGGQGQRGLSSHSGFRSLSPREATDADRKSEVCPSQELTGEIDAEPTSAVDERYGLARELHDGPAQELAFILMRGRQMLAVEPAAAALRAILASAQVALEDCRRIEAALASPRNRSSDAERGPARIGSGRTIGTRHQLPAARYDLSSAERAPETTAARRWGR